MIKVYLDKIFAKFSLIWPNSTNANGNFFGRLSCARNEPEKVVSKRLEE
jgi:hypothetical protein